MRAIVLLAFVIVCHRNTPIMTMTAIVQTRLDAKIKEAAERILTPLGLTAADATRLFFHQIVLQNDLPIEITTRHRSHVPNAETAEVLKQVEAGKDLHPIENVDDFFDSFKK
jgi:addiction module RelB/DinJ family antitoxin